MKRALLAVLLTTLSASRAAAAPPDSDPFYGVPAGVGDRTTVIRSSTGSSPSSTSRSRP